MYNYKKKSVLLFVCLMLFNSALPAEEVRIGTGTHSLSALADIIRLFEKQYPNDKIVILKDNYTSNTIYKQIKEKNDIDLVMFVGVEMGILLENEGLAIPKQNFTYALGKLVLWSKNPNLVDSKGEVLKTDNFQKIGILDPKIAIYGIASQQVLERLSVWDKVQAKLFSTNSAVELQQRVLDGSLDMAFLPLVTLNPNKKIEGSLWIIPKNYYRQLEHVTVLIKRAENNTAAKRFFEYLRSPQARNIFEKQGFSLP
ncbi:MAG: molybdate ABC transporter substrate-binding protein [Thiotrichaceae bacterium]|nr:molybdate ABC transporter substrate-binding protein [Thiotrichaceae bacterium]